MFLGSDFLELTDGKKIRNLTILLTCMYMVSYITRINYGAVIAEIAADLKILDSVASLAVTGSFITYGAGQLISGYMGDKIQPRILVFWGFVLTVLMNFSISFLSNPYVMTAVWSVNGFAQAFMWPPVVKLMAELLDGNNYKKTTVVVSYGASFGTIAAYFISSACVYIGSWRYMFVTSAIIGAIMGICWIKCCPVINMSIDTVSKQTNNADKVKMGFPYIVFAVMPVIVLQGALRDGVQTWMPKFIKNSFGLEGFLAILLVGLVLPVFAIICMRITSKIYQGKITNELLCAGTMLCVGMLSSLALYAFNGFNPVISTFFGAALTGSMHGVNMIMVCMIPPYFGRYGRVSLISGALNACTYVGSALSTYGIAKFSESFGWNNTILLWAGIAFLGAAICAMFASGWRNFCRK